MKKILTSIIVVFITVLTVYASIPPKLLKANKLYDSYNFVDAIELYKELAKQNIAIEEVTKKLANAYRLINDSKGAEEWYAKLVSMPGKTPIDIYHYAEALQQNGKQKEALSHFDFFHEFNPDDSRGKEWATNPGLLDRIIKDNSRFRVTHLSINSTGADFGTAFYGNKVIYTSNRTAEFATSHKHSWNNKAFLDLYVADQDDNNNLSNPKILSNVINTKFHDGPASVSSDGKTVYFTRNNYFKNKKGRGKDGTIRLEIYVAKKDAKDNWSTVNPFVYNSADYSIGHPSLSLDGKRLYFVSDMVGSIGETDIWYSDLQNDGSWAKPINCGREINTEGKELFPFISENNILFFASNGHVGMGGLDLFMSTVNNNVHSKSKNLGSSINTKNDDFAFIINKQENKGYFSSNREGGTGDDDIYSFEVLKKFKVSYSLSGIVVDKQTQQILPNSKVKLLDATGKIIEEVLTDEKGAYTFEVLADKEYRLITSQEKYLENKTIIKTNDLSEDQPEKIHKVELVKDLGYMLYCLITDKKTGEILSGVDVKFIDNTTKEPFINLTTDSAGDFNKMLLDRKAGDKLSYTIELNKKGYLKKEAQFNYTLAKAKIINVHEQLAIAMDKLEVGEDLAKIIDVKPIYFDVNKFNIRPDAAVELEKIVKVMAEYPNMVVELGSHTDCRASMKYNETLSDNRAKASAAYIKAKIAKPERIYGKGYGESKLKNGCACEGTVKSTCTEAEHQQNRRTEFIIIKL